MGISKTCRSRRAVLAGIASAAALPIAAAIPAGAKATVPEAADPIFAAIDAHRKAHAASAAAMTEIRRLGDLADSIVGDGIEVPCMIGEGSIRGDNLAGYRACDPERNLPC